MLVKKVLLLVKKASLSHREKVLLFDQVIAETIHTGYTLLSARPNHINGGVNISRHITLLILMMCYGVPVSASTICVTKAAEGNFSPSVKVR